MRNFGVRLDPNPWVEVVCSFSIFKQESFFILNLSKVSLKVAICHINVFCHQLIQNKTTDFVRFMKNYICSEIQTTSFDRVSLRKSDLHTTYSIFEHFWSATNWHVLLTKGYFIEGLLFNYWTFLGCYTRVRNVCSGWPVYGGQKSEREGRATSTSISIFDSYGMKTFWFEFGYYIFAGFKMPRL